MHLFYYSFGPIGMCVTNKELPEIFIIDQPNDLGHTIFI